jgi:hypothetical protein
LVTEPVRDGDRLPRLVVRYPVRNRRHRLRRQPRSAAEGGPVGQRRDRRVRVAVGPAEPNLEGVAREVTERQCAPEPSDDGEVRAGHRRHVLGVEPAEREQLCRHRVFVLRAGPRDPLAADTGGVGDRPREVVRVPLRQPGANEEVWVRAGRGVDRLRRDRLDLANPEVRRRLPEPAAESGRVADVVVDADRLLALVGLAHRRALAPRREVCW